MSKGQLEPSVDQDVTEALESIQSMTSDHANTVIEGMRELFVATMGDMMTEQEAVQVYNLPPVRAFTEILPVIAARAGTDIETVLPEYKALLRIASAVEGRVAQ